MDIALINRAIEDYMRLTGLCVDKEVQMLRNEIMYGILTRFVAVGLPG